MTEKGHSVDITRPLEPLVNEDMSVDVGGPDEDLPGAILIRV